MTPKAFCSLALCTAALVSTAVAQGDGAAMHKNEWLSWRGPFQNGTSHEEHLPHSVSGSEALAWSFELSGRGTPVVVGGRVFALGYQGEGDQLEEVLVCLDASSGEQLWEHRYTDFLSDVIYSRYAIGSPTVDQETGNILTISTSGLLSSFSPQGELRWQRSMMSEYGRLTFPNGRTGAVLVDGNLAIVHVATSAWGPHAPTRDRFYAFDKDTGEPIWSSTPGGPPKDTSFSYPVVADVGGRRVLYAGLAGGHLVCVDVRTGDALWKFPMSIGGSSSSPLLYGDSVIAVHGKENLDDSTIGRMVSIRRELLPEPGAEQLALGVEHENWRNDLVAFTSSPVLVGNRIYQTVMTGELCCIDADTGKVLWRKKLAPDQIHASPAWGDGKLYVPMNNGTLHVVEPTDDGAKILDRVQLDGNCLGAPAIAGGRVFVHTTERLYCFGGGVDGPPPQLPAAAVTAPGTATGLQVVPGDVMLQQGDTVPLRARSLDRNGLVVAESIAGVSWSGLPAGVTANRGSLRVADDAPPVAFVLGAASGDLQGTARIRVVPAIPFAMDFEGLKAGSFSPAYWVAAGRKWQVTAQGGGQVLARTLNNPLFQRTISFIGHPSASNYTVAVDIMTEGNRRIMSSAGVVNQRYLIILKGNHQELEVSSNMELLKVTAPFKWRRSVWYRLKTRVDVAADGNGVVRAKAWQRDDPEPKDWTIEVNCSHAHTHGAPGLYGFTPQSRFPVYLDNLSVTAND